MLLNVFISCTFIFPFSVWIFLLVENELCMICMQDVCLNIIMFDGFGHWFNNA
jgi:hypothetical protein